MTLPTGRVLVKGITYRTQTASAQMRCDACTEAIPTGSQYVRVLQGNTKKVESEPGRMRNVPRNPHAKVERFHVACFRTEFTDAES